MKKLTMKPLLMLIMLLGVFFCASQRVEAETIIKVGNATDVIKISAGETQKYKLQIKNKIDLTLIAQVIQSENENDLDSLNFKIYNNKKTLYNLKLSDKDIFWNKEQKLENMILNKGIYYIDVYYQVLVPKESAISYQLDLVDYKKYTKKIKFSNKSKTVYVGSKKRISAKKKGTNTILDGKIKYKSSNTKIATVNKNGVVKAKKTGKCYIYAWVKGGKKVKCKINVKKKTKSKKHSKSNQFKLGGKWTDYLGFDGKPGHTWYEAADGKVLTNNKKNWSVALNQIGWGGIWGAQMYNQFEEGIKGGKKYKIKCTLVSGGCNKWVFIKFGKRDRISYGKWVWLPEGVPIKINETFKAKYSADQITFGFGGEYGDRAETDGTEHYSLYPGGAKAIAKKKDANGDSGPHAGILTTISCSNFSVSTVGRKTGGTEQGKKMALLQAKRYLQVMPFSKKGLIKQLEYEGYTYSESVYGVDNCGANWNEQAVRMARNYLATMPFSKKGLIEQLEYEGFTHKQAVYGAKKNGY